MVTLLSLDYFVGSDYLTKPVLYVVMCVKGIKINKPKKSYSCVIIVFQGFKVYPWKTFRYTNRLM